MPGGEASGPGQIGGRTDLGGPDVSLPLHVQQPLHVVGVGLHVLHPGGHTPFLVAEEKQPLRYLLRTCYLPGPGERVVGHTEAAFAHTGDDSK